MARLGPVAMVSMIESDLMNARLKVLHEKANVKTVKLLPSTVIGRSTECDLKIASSEVSRVHCRITVKEDAVYVEDLGSANGTFVNDQMLNPRQPIAVQPGAKLTIGPAEFLVDYIAPTSNTVVVRRSDKGSRGAVANLAGAAESDGKDLIFSSMAEAPEVSAAEETLLVDPADKIVALEKEALSAAPAVEAPNPVAEPELKVETPQEVPPAVPAPETVQPAVKAEPIAIPAAVVAAPVETPPKVAPEAPPKVAAALPVAPAVAKVVPVTAAVAKAVPTAKAVPIQAQPVPTNPLPAPMQPSKTRLPQVVLPVSSPQLAAAPVVPTKPPAPAPATAPVVAEFLQFGAPEPAAAAAQEVPTQPAEQDGLQFGFSTETEEPRRTSKPAAKDGKAGGFKSLLSVFGKKPNAAASKSKSAAYEPEVAEPPPAPVAEEPAVASPVEQQPAVAPPAEQEQFSFGFGAPEPAASNDPAEKPAADDDFQQFLRQF